MFVVVCMDCQRVYKREESPEDVVSHGICVKCFAERVGAVEASEVNEWLDAQLDELPTGRIVLDGSLCVIGYNREEEKLSSLDGKELIGKPFFQSIAPCMSGEDLSGWCARFVHNPSLVDKSIDWLLKLKTGPRIATLDICAGRGRVVIIVNVTPKPDAIDIP